MIPFSAAMLQHLRRNDPLVYGLVAVAAFQIALGLYAVALNQLFYTQFGPFYDSMGYLNHLAEMKATARQSGGFDALVRELNVSTVAYPWLIFAPYARSASIARSNGIWIQVAAAIYMHGLLFYYFLRVRGLPFGIAFVFSASFMLIAAVFDYNGGLSDFRMDLLQYIFLTAVLATYLIARSSNGWGWWIVLGLNTGLLCLGRATSPVYLAIIFLVLFGTELVVESERRGQVMSRWFMAGAATVVVAGWFYLRNFDMLYYYYFEWNPDANARLPLVVSRQHVSAAVNHVGRPLWYGLACVCLIVAAISVRQVGFRRLRLNWQPLVFSAVPLGYLVATGAGLNPFVSIVGVSGVILFMLAPFSGSSPSPKGWIAASLLAALLAGGLANAATGPKRHTDARGKSHLARQDGLRQIVRTVATTVESSQRARAYTYAVIHIGAITPNTLFNTMVHDHSYPAAAGQAVALGASSLRRASGIEPVSTEKEWRTYPGGTDSERIDALAMRVNERADFLLMDVEGSKSPSHVYMNRFVPDLNRRILEHGEWTRIGSPIPVNAVESIAVLRNERRLRVH
jgi:hypothetical protein